MSRWKKLLLRAFAAVWPGDDNRDSVGACANRRWRRFMSGPVEVTITYRDTRRPDGYSREELVEMLKTIREQEKMMGWKVPEPVVVVLVPMCKMCGYPEVAHGRNIYACGRFQQKAPN
jgi:hypothetical protein